jgi:plasmid stabilization system protein ParE
MLAGGSEEASFTVRVAEEDEADLEDIAQYFHDHDGPLATNCDLDRLEETSASRTENWGNVLQ